MLQAERTADTGKVADERFVREDECRFRSGISRTRRWELMREGKFPQSRLVPGTERTKAWLNSELEAWMRGDWQPRQVLT